MSGIPIDPALASLSEAANDPEADMLEMDMSGFVQDFTKQNEDDVDGANDTLQSLHGAELERKRQREADLDVSHMDAGTSQMHDPISAYDTNADGGFTTVLETGEDGDEDDDDEDAPPSKRGRMMQDPDGVPGGFTLADKDSDSGRRKIRIEYIGDKSRRHITFSKRKAGIMKKAYELSTLTGTQVLLLVVSETGLVYTFTTAKLQPLVTKAEGKNLIQACLNAPDGIGPDGLPTSGPVPATSRGKNGNGLAIRPHKLSPAATAQLAASAQSASGLHPNAAPPPQDVQSPPIDSSIPGRPRKRMPSGKGKKALAMASQEAPPPMPDALPTSELVPPPLDLHRQGGQSPHVLSSMQSPLSATFGHHMPQEYQATGYYQQHPGQNGGQPYFSGGDVYQQQHQHQQFMSLQQQQQQSYADFQRDEHARMVMQQQQQDRQRLGIQ